MIDNLYLNIKVKDTQKKMSSTIVIIVLMFYT